MLAILGVDVVTLQMKRNVAKGIRIAVDVQRPHVTSPTAVVVELLTEEMREV